MAPIENSSTQTDRYRRDWYSSSTIEVNKHFWMGTTDWFGKLLIIHKVLSSLKILLIMNDRNEFLYQLAIAGLSDSQILFDSPICQSLTGDRYELHFSHKSAIYHLILAFLWMFSPLKFLHTNFEYFWILSLAFEIWNSSTFGVFNFRHLLSSLRASDHNLSGTGRISKDLQILWRDKHLIKSHWECLRLKVWL